MVWQKQQLRLFNTPIAYRFVLLPLLPAPTSLLVPTRPDYMTTFVDKLINWDAVAKRYEAATA
jgi:hypothetical protein